MLQLIHTALRKRSICINSNLKKITEIIHFYFRHVNDQSAMNDPACHENIKVLEVEDTLKQESLVSENIPDSMDAEQTWPTEEEIKDAQEEQKVTFYSFVFLRIRIDIITKFINLLSILDKH